MPVAFKRNFLSIFSISLFILTFSIIGSAQDLDNATIRGQVTDSNNAPIVGANVTATLTTTGVERTVVTDEDGRFNIVKLEPGTYSVKFSANGFGVKEQKDLVTVAGQNVQLNITLAPAGVTAEQTITIDGDDAPAVDTTRTVVGGTIQQREIEELPNNSRNPLDLVLTLGGVTEEQLSTRDLSSDRGQRGISAPGTTPEEAGTFAVGGGAAYSNNITIDGLDNNDDRSASFRFQPSIESVAEVQVITNQFSAEYGRASGGRVNIRTRGGSNKLRGRAFYFFRDDNLNANTWNNNRRGIERPPFTNHNPGFTFGGPLVKNKLFFFTAYEYDNIQEDTVVDAYVPLTNGNSKFTLPAPTDTSPSSIITIAASAGFPAVQIAPYVELVSTPAKKHIFSARGDWNLNTAHNFTFGYQLGLSDDLRAFSGTNRIADSLIGRIRNTDAYNATYNLIASANVVNQFRTQYSRLRPRSNQSSGNLTPAVLVSTSISGATTQVFGSTTNSSDRREDRWQFQDTLTVVAGSHTLRFGGDFQRVDTTFIDRFDATGTYTYSSFVFYNVNSVSRFQQNFNNTSDVKNNYYGFFVQDDWRIRPNLTLSYGIRYERETVVDDNNNWGPRFAIAWNPFPKEEKTVFRFGAGIFYNRVLLRTIDDFTSDSQALRLDTNSLNVPTGVTVDLNVVRPFLSTQFPNGLTLNTVIPVNAANSYPVSQLARASSVFRSLSPDIKIPESYQFNGGFERELFKGLVFETNVTYNKTVHLWREFNPNAPSLAKLNQVTGRNFTNFTEFLLSRDFDNFPGAGNTARPFLGGTTNTSANRIRFILTPFNNSASGAQVGVGITNTDLGGIICINGAATCANSTNNPNPNRYYLINLNSVTTTNLSSPIITALAILNQYRADPTQGDQERVISVGDSAYLGATFELRNRYRKFGYGFAGSMRLVYTLSSLRDDGIVNTSEATIPGDFEREWSRSLLDRRHRISITGTLDTPKWMGGLRFSPLLRYGSSAPFNVSAGGIDRNLDGINNDRPNYFGSPFNILWREFGSAFSAELASQFGFATIGSPGNLRRNAGRGPELFLFDLTVSREFKIGERFRIRPSAEFDNVFNATVFSFGSNFINFDLLNSTDAATVAAARDAFLAPTRTYRPRQIRLGIRFDF